MPTYGFSWFIQNNDSGISHIRYGYYHCYVNMNRLHGRCIESVDAFYKPTYTLGAPPSRFITAYVHIQVYIYMNVHTCKYKYVVVWVYSKLFLRYVFIWYWYYMCKYRINMYTVMCHQLMIYDGLVNRTANWFNCLNHIINKNSGSSAYRQYQSIYKLIFLTACQLHGLIQKLTTHWIVSLL